MTLHVDENSNRYCEIINHQWLKKTKHTKICLRCGEVINKKV